MLLCDGLSCSMHGHLQVRLGLFLQEVKTWTHTSAFPEASTAPIYGRASIPQLSLANRYNTQMPRMLRWFTWILNVR